MLNYKQKNKQNVALQWYGHDQGMLKHRWQKRTLKWESPMKKTERKIVSKVEQVYIECNERDFSK